MLWNVFVCWIQLPGFHLHYAIFISAIAIHFPEHVISVAWALSRVLQCSGQMLKVLYLEWCNYLRNSVPSFPVFSPRGCWEKVTNKTCMQTRSSEAERLITTRWALIAVCSGPHLQIALKIETCTRQRCRTQQFPERMSSAKVCSVEKLPAEGSWDLLGCRLGCLLTFFLPLKLTQGFLWCFNKG